MYAKSILPTDAIYYTLYKARIVDGIMALEPGGSASYTVTEDTLSTLPESFRISIIPRSRVDNYSPKLFAFLRIVTTEGTENTYTFTPTVDASGVYTQDVDVNAGTYESCTFTIESDDEIQIQLWELCPAAGDSSIEIEIDGVKQQLPKLLYDYNAAPLMVNQFETTIGLITFNLKYANDLQGNISFSYVASSDCVLTIRVKDTGVTELYTPVLYELRKGRGNIALPHAYLSRSVGLHSTYVTAQVSAGTLTIDTRGLLYTIDGGYIAERELDAGMEVHDISVCNTEGDTEPEDLWVIGISANECLVKTREYSNDASVGFTPVFTLGEAKKAAIEFNGTYYLNRSKGHERYTLVTDYVPYVFWIDLRGNLLCQYGSDEETRFVMDTNVSDLSVCRGFSSTLVPTQDQGLIVLYIKNGVAKYMNYCYDANRNGDIDSSDSYSWQGPYTVNILENVISVNVHRLNDYRVGFLLTTPTSNWWYISERTYVTQTMEPTTVSVGYDSAPRLGVFHKDSTYTFSVTAALDNTKRIVTLTFSHDVKQLYNDETFLPEEFTGVRVESIEVIDAKNIKVHLREAINASSVLTYNTSGIIKFTIEPVENMEVPLTAFTANIDMVPLLVDTVKETIAVKYDTSASIALIPVGAKTTNSNETVQVVYSSSAAIQQLAISNKTCSATDTATVNYAVTGSITLTQVGTHPI